MADLNLTDKGTGYKAFRLSLVRSLPLRENGFGYEPELTVKLAQRRVALYEVPISYRGRTYDEGKKIRPKDALVTLFSIFYYGLQRDIYLDSGRAFWMLWRRRRTSTAGWPAPCGRGWDRACSRSGPASAT